MVESPTFLAKPLDNSTAKLYEQQVKQVKTNALERLKFTLPDCSEPCTCYHAEMETARK